MDHTRQDLVSINVHILDEDSLPFGSAGLPVSWRHTWPHPEHVGRHPARAGSRHATTTASAAPAVRGDAPALPAPHGEPRRPAQSPPTELVETGEQGQTKGRESSVGYFGGLSDGQCENSHHRKTPIPTTSAAQRPLTVPDHTANCEEPVRAPFLRTRADPCGQRISELWEWVVQDKPDASLSVLVLVPARVRDPLS